VGYERTKYKDTCLGLFRVITDVSSNEEIIVESCLRGWMRCGGDFNKGCRRCCSPKHCSCEVRAKGVRS